VSDSVLKMRDEFTRFRFAAYDICDVLRGNSPGAFPRPLEKLRISL